jgi:hypothetical protein
MSFIKLHTKDIYPEKGEPNPPMPIMVRADRIVSIKHSFKKNKEDEFLSKSLLEIACARPVYVIESVEEIMEMIAGKEH